MNPAIPDVPEKLETDVLNTITRSVNQTAKTLKPVSESVPMETVVDPSLALEGLPLQGNIMPPPGTKVTTTVRTYTYEIPGGESLPAPTNRSIVYNTSSHTDTMRSTNTTLDRNRPERDIPIPETTIYRNESYTNDSTTNYLPENRYPDSDRPRPGRNVTYVSETYNNTANNFEPEVDRPFPVPGVPSEPGTNKTIIYKRDVRDTTTTNYPGPNNRPTSPVNGYPPTTNVEVYKEDVTNTTTNHHPVHPSGPNFPPHGGYPDGPKTTYYYKHESSNTTNRRYGPPGSATNPPRHNEPQPLMMTPVNEPPRENGTVTYKYSTQTTSRNINHDETDNLLKPAPFPAPVPRHTPVNASSPKRLEDLLSNFDDVIILPGDF